MSVSERHNEIIRLLKKSDVPLSGSYLSGVLGVSRQIIVSDISQINSTGIEIIATSKGYILSPSYEVIRIFKVFHTVQDTETELKLITDLGAEVKDVSIYHKVYGEIHAPLNISTRREIQMFCDDIKSGKSSPLMTATGGYHYHTVAAGNDETLDLVEDHLRRAGFLARLTDYEPTGAVGR